MLEALRRRWAHAKSDVIIAVGAPVLGVVGILVGLGAGDTTTAVFGAIALVLGLVYAIPLARSGGADPGDDDLSPPPAGPTPP